MIEQFNNNKYTEYLDHLYKRINIKYPDCRETDNLVQETLLAYVISERKQKIENPKAFLNTVLAHKYNDMLREKYRNSIISYELPDTSEENIAEDHTEEYENVRREIGRLIKIYREVTVLYYVKKHSVEDIAKELDIPKGTVLSRLSKARKQVKEGIEKMEKYSEISYQPKHLEIGIWGGPSLGGAPFSVISTPIEENILILAYHKPLSVKTIADTMGIPCAYIEPIVQKLIDGELVGETSGGLVYTRCFIQSYLQSLGNIEAQEELADKYAKAVWNTVSDSFMPLLDSEPYSSMTYKQKATFLLFITHRILSLTKKSITRNKDHPTMPLERKNGGRWVAFGKVFEQNEKKIEKYETSGPAQFGYWENDKLKCKMLDFQSVFGATHYAYRTFKYNCRMESILRFYASFVNKSITTDNDLLYELYDDFEALNIIRINEQGKHELDIPVIPFDEWERISELCTNTAKKINSDLIRELKEIWNKHNNNIPNHVDIHYYYTHTGGLAVYPIAQMLSIIDKGIFPYKIDIGKTPIILLICDTDKYVDTPSKID